MLAQSTHSRSPFRSLQLSLLAVLPFSMHGPSPPLLQCSSKAAAGNPPTDRPRPDSLDQEEKKKKRNPTCLTPAMFLSRPSKVAIFFEILANYSYHTTCRIRRASTSLQTLFRWPQCRTAGGANAPPGLRLRLRLRPRPAPAVIPVSPSARGPGATSSNAQVNIPVSDPSTHDSSNYPIL